MEQFRLYSIEGVSQVAKITGELYTEYNSAVVGVFDWINGDNPIIAPPERDAWFCMHWQWAMDAFHNSLGKVGIDYRPSSDILAFYCYHFLFSYLGYYFDSYFDKGNVDDIVLADLSAYLKQDCWINSNLTFVDKLV
jgi:hypothetical protein